jgi:anti-sigma factor RsiW
MSHDSDPREQLSALADGELGRDETRFLLRRLDQSPGLARSWESLHRVRSALRHEPGAWPDAGFADAVAARIAAEAAPSRQRPWLQTAIGGAIAAGVAALALFAVAPVPQSPTAGTPVLAEVAPIRTGDLEMRLPAQRVSDRMWAPLPVSAPVDPQVESYFLRHSGLAAGSPRGGFLPYVYVVATPAAAAPVPLRQDATPNGR